MIWKRKIKSIKIAKKYNREIIIYDAKQIEEKIIEAGVTQHYGCSWATYYKLFFDEFLSKDIKRIFYVDDDTVILGSLKELFEMKMDKPLAIVQDSCPFPLIKMTSEEKKRAIYNCGTYLLDVDMWNKNRCKERILEYMLNKQELYHHD